MYKSNLHLRNNKGQILVEAVVVSLLMVVIMLAFQKIVELKNSVLGIKIIEKNFFFFLRKQPSAANLVTRNNRSTSLLAAQREWFGMLRVICI